jgi:hypothetical protein
MRISNQILFVSAGMSAPKKRDHILARRQLYLNYGALTLATLLHMKGYAPVLVHGNHSQPNAFVKGLCEDELLPTRYPIMLSIPSFYALGWARQFCKYVKILFPQAKIVVGGRWVVGPDPIWIKRQIPEIDLVVPGLAEGMIENTMMPSPWRSPDGTTADFAARPNSGLPSFHLNHLLIRNFHQFQPSIEVSRGCGMGCAFCEERDIPLSRLRAPDDLANFMADTIEQYGSKSIRPYFQSSFFLPNPRWAQKLHAEIQKRDCLFSWRCETRVDGLAPETIELLAKSGLRAIDLGLETASPEQIVRMKKARRPDYYLRAASDVLSLCKRYGIWVKINILLYAGENHRTLDETTSWLRQHADRIKGVSVGPVVIFGPPKQACSLIEEMEAMGASVVDTKSAEETGITAIHPSTEIDAAAAEDASLMLSRAHMDHKGYYELKSFSYYPRDYAYEDYLSDIRASDPKSLPFDVSNLVSKVGGPVKGCDSEDQSHTSASRVPL